MPAKKANKPEYAQLSLKIEKSLNDEVEVFWRRNLYQDKSSLVREALDYYIHASKCDRCGAVNHNRALFCAICGASLCHDDRGVIEQTLAEVSQKLEAVLHLISKEVYV